jgi:Short-chain dehydrogenases of various substrate specificities
MDPKDRMVWVTGASSGIGKALAVELAKEGAAGVLLSARRMDRLEETAEECRRHGARVWLMPLDLSRPDALAAGTREAAEKCGDIDILVNAAGVGQRGTALETTTATARRIMEVDFWGAVELTRAVVPGMLRRGSGQVVAVTGVLGKFGAPRRSFYSAGKHALHGWFESLREEIFGQGVEITLIVPGWVLTEISEQALEADGGRHGVTDRGQLRGISAEECARRAITAIREGRAEQLIGGIECGGVYLNRLWPALFKKLLRKRGIG